MNGTLTPEEHEALADAFALGWDYSDNHARSLASTVVPAVERIVAAHVARATADAEIVRAEWERQYGYAIEAAERFRKQAADAEARLAAAIERLTALTEGVDRVGTAKWDERDRNTYSLAIEEAQAALRAALDPAPSAPDPSSE
jgi:hypothetical protein